MSNIAENQYDLLDGYVSGLRVYDFGDSICIIYASRSFCDLLAISQDDASAKDISSYMRCIHPDDVDRYHDFISRASQKPQIATLCYRILGRDGVMKRISETITTKEQEDKLIGYSIIADITSSDPEAERLFYMNETVHCGLIRFTCQKHPKVISFNEELAKMLHFPASKMTSIEKMFREDIFLLIPFDDRKRFAHYLEHASKETPIAGEVTALRFDGTTIRMYGWIIKSTNSKGKDEFQCVCMDISERYKIAKMTETERYVKALSKAYDRIFEYDFAGGIVKCLHSPGSVAFEKMNNLPMQLDEATRLWIDNNVVPEDLDKVRAFFDDAAKEKSGEDKGKPRQITYRALSSTGGIRTYAGTFIDIGSGIGLYCCRYLTEAKTSIVQVDIDSSSDAIVSIRTFGYFDIFIDHKPIIFRSDKSKELLALLVDRRGGYISSDEAIGFLWEDEPVNSVTLARYRKVALRLKNTLLEYGISDIVESINGKRRLVTDKVKCDLYDYLSQDDRYADLFKGSYLTNYSWGENTLAELMHRQS